MNRLYKNSNRYEFLEKLKSNSEYYLVCIDIINFKNINDRFGFYNGDHLLIEIIEYINKMKDEYIQLKVCRHENDIIMIMIESIQETDIIRIINKVLTKRYRYNIKFRIGYKRIENIQDIDDFFDSVKYVIKDKKYVIEKSMDRSFEMSKDIQRYTTLKKDIMNKRVESFNLVYQPKISTVTKQVDSCEVLSRWNNTKIGSLSPYEFLPIIKRLDKEIEFDLVIFEKACFEISHLEGIISEFSINISIKSISNNEFVDKICLLAEKYNIDPNNIMLEILEDIYEEDYVEISKNIDRLVGLGYSISIDDFGTGYSSYCRLAELNFSEVKIPREFLKLDHSADAMKTKKILSGIVSMCKALKCKIVIEGVQTEEHVKLAEILKIDTIQGYYYSQPLDKVRYALFVREYRDGGSNEI